MKRRSVQTSGVVNFPVEDPEWEFSQEGGTVVKMIVLAPADKNEFQLCFGAYVTDFLSETLPRHDILSKHYPYINSKHIDAYGRNLSVGYLAAVVIGSTGWVGYSRKNGECWSCELSNLSERGQCLYEMFKEMYPGCKIELLTFIDT